jgi:hypothetical protein
LRVGGCLGLVAAQILRRHAWWLLSLLAALGLIVLALQGSDRSTRLEQHVASGTMNMIGLDQVQKVEIEARTRRWQLIRQGRQWLIEPAVGPVAGERTALIVEGLTLLRNATSEREFDVAPPEFGLASPTLRLRVIADASPGFELAFGGLNPMGLAHYAQLTVAGKITYIMLPSYVLETWEKVIGLR